LRKGFNDRDIVALSGAHTLGRAFKNRSGVVENGPSNPTTFTSESHVARADGKAGVGMAGGKSWTKTWLSFDNSYFTGLYETPHSDLLVLPTDKVLMQDPSFKPTCELYAKSQEAFFIDYASVHSRLSELGSKFFCPG
jgi:L-ascorbate peroxidase